MRYYRKLLSSFVIFSLMFTLLIPASFSIEYVDEHLNYNEGMDYIEGVVIVQFDHNIDEIVKNEHRKELGLTIEKKFRKPGLELLKLNKNKNVADIVAKLNTKKGIVFAEPDYILRSIYAPDDTYFDILWGLDNLIDIDIDAPEAWGIQMGSNDVIVAVIDTGVQINHEDLIGQFVDGWDFYNNDASVYDGTDDYHGTHVSGTIAASANDIGVIGVAPNVKIMPLKFLGPDGGSTSDAIRAIEYAKDKGADVINASWGGGGYSSALKRAIEDFGGPFVAAAGNSKKNTDYRAHYPSSYNSSNIISVAAIDSSGKLASFSNYGEVSVDVGAPGVDIASTYPGGYAYMSGTSMAAPHVAGIAALMLSQDPNLTTNDLIDVLYANTVQLESLSGKTSTGGLVNAFNAVSALNVADTTPPIFEYSVPEDGSIGVLISSDIKVTFSEAIAESTEFKSIRLNDGTSNVAISKAIVDDVLTVVPTSKLFYNTSYTLTIPANSVKDASANNLTDQITITFTTESEPVITPPPTTVQVVSYTDQRNIALSGNVNIYFIETEDVNLLDVRRITIVDKHGEVVNAEITFNNDPNSDNSDSSPDYVIINPDSDLSIRMSYTVTLLEGAVKTSDGFDSELYIFKFSTVKK